MSDRSGYETFAGPVGTRAGRPGAPAETVKGVLYSWVTRNFLSEVQIAATNNPLSPGLVQTIVF